jgi:hypothetical protein
MTVNEIDERINKLSDSPTKKNIELKGILTKYRKIKREEEESKFWDDVFKKEMEASGNTLFNNWLN